MSWPIRVDLLCKLIYTWYMIAEQLSSFTLLLFSVERFVVVHFPLHAKSLISFRRTMIITGVVLLSIALCSTHLYFSTNSIRLRLNTYCAVSEELSGPFLAALYWFWMGVESYFLPTLVSIILNMFILRRILSASAKRQIMSVGNSKIAASTLADSSSAARERRATMSLVFISIAHTIIYTPSIIVAGYLGLTFLQLIPIPAVLDVNILVELSWVSVHMTNIGKVCLFIVIFLIVSRFLKVNLFLSFKKFLEYSLILGRRFRSLLFANSYL